MEMLIRNNYIMSKPNKKKLKENGFRYNKQMSDSDCDYYSIRFPCIQYNQNITIEGEIIVNLNSGKIKLNAYDCNKKGCYSPFYLGSNKVYEPIMSKINNVFLTIFSKFGIQKAGD